MRRCVHLPDWSPCHLVCHFSTSLRLISLQMASFAQAISCRLVNQVSFVLSWKVSFLSSDNKSIGGKLARTSTALVDTVRYAETILITTPRCTENSFFWIAWLLKALVQTGALFSSSKVKSSSRRTTQELRSSSHQSLGDYFEGETPWVLLDLSDQVFPALKSAFLYALPQSWFCFFPCLTQQRITLWAGKSPPCCEAFLTQDK